MLTCIKTYNKAKIITIVWRKDRQYTNGTAWRGQKHIYT